jgi:PEP-CTERM motif-containing protein
MRKFLLVVVVLIFGTVLAPKAHADTFADASFTCTSSCADVPVDPLVSFPSPTIPVTFFGQTFDITLNQFDKSTDTYSWTVALNGSSWSFVINDLTNGFFNLGPSYFSGGNGTPYGSGGVNFTGVPEPGSGSLLLLGLALAFIALKFKAPRPSQRAV